MTTVQGRIQDFPLGGRQPLMRHFLAKMCVEMKKTGPVGRGRTRNFCVQTATAI